MITLSQNRPAFSSYAQRAVEASNVRSRLALERYRDAQIKEFKAFWSQPRADIEAQLAIRGNKAVAAFSLHAAAVMHVLNAGIDYPSADYTPPLPYTAHEDGTITLD